MIQYQSFVSLVKCFFNDFSSAAYRAEHHKSRCFVLCTSSTWGLALYVGKLITDHAAVGFLSLINRTWPGVLCICGDLLYLIWKSSQRISTAPHSFELMDSKKVRTANKCPSRIRSQLIWMFFVKFWSYYTCLDDDDPVFLIIFDKSFRELQGLMSVQNLFIRCRKSSSVSDWVSHDLRFYPSP